MPWSWQLAKKVTSHAQVGAVVVPAVEPVVALIEPQHAVVEGVRAASVVGDVVHRLGDGRLVGDLGSPIKAWSLSMTGAARQVQVIASSAMSLPAEMGVVKRASMFLAPDISSAFL
jgi:hypothetical protein